MISASKDPAFSRISRRVFLFSLVIFGLVSLFSGKELEWDVLSYHFYNPFALLHHRWNIDTWSEAYIQMYFNPLLDFLSYFLIQMTPPKAAEFIMGAIHGINFWLLFRISHLVVSEDEKKHSILWSLILASVGMYGAVTFFEIGSFMGDTLVSLFILSALYLLLSLIKNQPLTNFKIMIASGLLFGLGVGFKIAVGYLAVGFWLASYFLPGSRVEKLKMFLSWNIAALFGFLLTDGYWMAFLWQHFHSPFYPLFNQIFHAPGFPFLNWHDPSFLPLNKIESIFFPVIFTINPHHISDYFFVDYRYIAVYLLFCVSLPVFIWRKIPTTVEKPRVIFFLLSFYLGSYITWELSLSVIRYAITLEMLTPLIIYILINYLFKNKTLRLSLLSGLFLTMIVTMVPLEEPRLSWNNHSYFGVQLPDFVKNIPAAMVLSISPDFMRRFDLDYFTRTKTQSIEADIKAFTRDDRAMTYLIPFFPDNWRFTGIVVIGSPTPHYALSEKIKTTIANYPGPFYLLTTDGNLPSFYQFAELLSLKKSGECGRVLSDPLSVPGYDHQTLLLCPVSKKIV